MEEMESEGIAAAEIYQPDDVVWVKISFMWWVAEVKNPETLEPDAVSFKKKPLVVVKFLLEDAYECIHSYERIYHYNCKRKDEFLKLGFKKYAKMKNEKNVSLFPEVIQEAERRTGGNPDIINDPNYLPPEVQEQTKVENGGRSSLPADFKGKKANAPRRSVPAPSRDDSTEQSSESIRPPIVKDGPTWYPYPKMITYESPVPRKPPCDDHSAVPTVLVRCCKCCFETSDAELLWLHVRYNQHNTTLGQPDKYRWRNPLNKKGVGSGARKKSVIRKKKDSVSKPTEKTPAKKKKKDLPPVPVFTPPKKATTSLPGTPGSLEVSQECAKIIEEWTDDEDDNKPLDETDLINCSASTNDNTMEITGASELGQEKSTLDTSPQKVEKPSEPPKSSSCFDFDEEETSEPGLQSSGKFGQIRLPRVITPEKSKPPDPLNDGNDIDSLLKEVSVPEIPSLPPSKQDSLFSRGDRTYGSSPFKEAKKSGLTSPVKSDSSNDKNADVENNKNEEKHFLAEGPLQSKKRKSFGRTEGAEDGSDSNKKQKVGTSPQKPSSERKTDAGTARTSFSLTSDCQISGNSNYSNRAAEAYASMTDDIILDEPNNSIPPQNVPPSIVGIKTSPAQCEPTFKSDVLDNENLKAEPTKLPDDTDLTNDKPKPSRRSSRRKSGVVSQEASDSPPQLVDETLRRRASPEKSESPRSSKRSKKHKTHQEMPELEPFPTEARGDSLKSPISSHLLFSSDMDSVPSPSSKTTCAAARKKTKKSEPTEETQLQSEQPSTLPATQLVPPVDATAVESDAEKIVEPIKSPPAVDLIDSTQSISKPSRKSRRNKSQEITELKSIPVEETSKREASSEEQESPRASRRNKTPKSSQKSQLPVFDDSSSKADEFEESESIKSPPALDTFDSVQSAPRPSRKSRQNKSQNSNPPAVVVDETLAPPEEPESLGSSRGSRSSKSPQKMPELQVPVNSYLRAEVSPESSDHVKLQHHEEELPSNDIESDRVVSKPPRSSITPRTLVSAEVEPSLVPELPKKNELQSIPAGSPSQPPQEITEESVKSPSNEVELSNDITQDPVEKKPLRPSRKSKKVPSEVETKAQSEKSEPVSITKTRVVLDSAETLKSLSTKQEIQLDVVSEVPVAAKRTRPGRKGKELTSPENMEVKNEIPEQQISASFSADNSLKGSIDSFKLPCEPAVPASITPESGVRKSPRGSKKTKPESPEAELKVPPMNDSQESSSMNQTSIDIPELLKSPSDLDTPKVDEPPRTNRRSLRNRSQEVPVSIPLPEECLPKPDDSKTHQESHKPSITHPELSDSLMSSPKVNDSTQSSRRSKQFNSREVPVSIPLPEGHLPCEENTPRAIAGIPELLKSPNQDEAPRMPELSSNDSYSVDDKFNKRTKKLISTPEVPASVPNKEVPQDHFTVKSPKSSDQPLNSESIAERELPKTGPASRQLGDGSMEIESPSSGGIFDVSGDSRGMEVLETSASNEMQDMHSSEVCSAGKSVAPSPLKDATELSGGDQKNSVPEPVSCHQSLLLHSHNLEGIPNQAAANIDPIVALQLQLETPQSSKDDAGASVTESKTSKTQSILAEHPQNDVSSLLALESDSPCVKELTPVDSKGNESVFPSRKSRRISSREALTPKPQCEDDITASEISSSHLEPSVLPSFDATFDNVPMVEAKLALDKDQPPLAGVISTAELHNRNSNDLSEGNSLLPLSKSSVIPPEPIEPKSSDPKCPKSDSSMKKSFKVADAKRLIREPKATEKAGKAASNLESDQQEKSDRELRSVTKDDVDISKRCPLEENESKRSKKEIGFKEKKNKDKHEQNTPKQKPANQVQADLIGSIEDIGKSDQVPSGFSKELESPVQCNDIEDQLLSSKAASPPRKRKSKWDSETPKAEDAVKPTKTESDAGAVLTIEDNKTTDLDPLGISVFDSQNEIVVDTELDVTSPKKQMALSPSKTFRQDEAASLLEELLGSSPKSSPSSSPKKTKAESPVEVTSRTADIKFSLSPSKVLDFVSPTKTEENRTDFPDLSLSKSPSSMNDSSVVPVKASRWDSPSRFPIKSPNLASSVRSPGKKGKVEIKSGLGRACLKSLQENNILNASPKLPKHLEPDSSNSQSDDELSALQAEILSFSALDKAKSTPAPAVLKETSDLAKELEDPPSILPPPTAVISSSNVVQGDKESWCLPNESTGTATNQVGLATMLPPNLNEAELLCMDDAYSIPLDGPVTAESVTPFSSGAISSGKPSNTPIFITVPSDSTACPGTAAASVDGTLTLGNNTAQGFGGGSDLLDINSIPIILQDEGSMTFSEAPATMTGSSSGAMPVVAREAVSSISLPSVKQPEQLSSVTSTPSIPTTTTDQNQAFTEPVDSIPLPPEPSVLKPSLTELGEAVNEEVIETEIVMDHSEIEQEDSQSVQSDEEKFAQLLVKHPWIRPDLLENMSQEGAEKKVYEAKKVTQIVIRLFDEDDPEYSYYESLPPCQLGTGNFTPSWAKVGAPKIRAAPAKAGPSMAKPTARQMTPNQAGRQALSIDKSKSIVTVARPDKAAGEIDDSPPKSLSIVGTQSLSATKAGASPSKASGSQVKQQLLQLFNQAKSGELDPVTARKLTALTSHPDFIAKLNKQQKTVVSSQPSAEVKVQPRIGTLTMSGKTAILRTLPTTKPATSVSGSPVVVCSKPVLVDALSTSDSRVCSNIPKANILAATTRGEPLKFTMDQKFMNIKISSNSPKYVVACDPKTGVPSVKSQIVMARTGNMTQPANTMSAGSSRTIVATQNNNVPSPGTIVVSARSTNPPSHAITVSPGSTVKLVSAVSQQPRPRIVQRVKTIKTPNVPSVRLATPQAVRVRKQSLQGSPQAQRPVKPENFVSYVTLTNSMGVPTSSEQVLVVNKKKPAVAPGSDILAKALADTDILPSDSEPFVEEPSPDAFNQSSSVVISGSVGADQLSNMSFNPAETDNVNR